MGVNSNFERFKKACMYWKKIFKLDDYTFIFTKFDNEVVEEKNYNLNQSKASNFIICSTVDTSPEYRYAIIEVHENSFDGASNKDIDNKACHEVIHILMAPYASISWKLLQEIPSQERKVYKKWRKSEEEEFTSRLAGIICTLKK